MRSYFRNCGVVAFVLFVVGVLLLSAGQGGAINMVAGCGISTVIFFALAWYVGPDNE